MNPKYYYYLDEEREYLFVVDVSYWNRFHCMNDTTSRVLEERLKPYGFREAMENVFKSADIASSMKKLKADPLFGENKAFSAFVEDCG